jgi:hypothetical protein
MNATLAKALVALVPAGILFVGAVLLFLREKILGSFLQLLGVGCLVVVVLAHIAEALHLFPWMHWGEEHSVGHYLDLGVLFLASPCFPWDICFMRLQKGTPNVQARNKEPAST